MRLENGYYYFSKIEKMPLSPHFVSSEFACQCKYDTCDESKVSKELVDKLEAARVACGISIRITSGYRCRAHQLALAAQGKETATGISQHELGNAADVAAKDMDALLAALEPEFKAIGVAKSFIHVDLRSDRDRRWGYKKE